jgi:hypothetical protein
MKKIIGGKELLSKAKHEAKKQDKRRVKRLVKRHAAKLVKTQGTPPVLSPEITTPAPLSQN